MKIIRVFPRKTKATPTDEGVRQAGEVRGVEGEMSIWIQPILDVWEQYKHLDILLSDEEWMAEEGHTMSPQRRCLYDLWKAVKTVATRVP